MVLEIGIFVALVVAAWALFERQRLAGQVGTAATDAGQARADAEQAKARAKDLENKLAKSREAVGAQGQNEAELRAAIQALEEDKRRLRETVERTATRSNQPDGQTRALEAQIERLTSELAAARAQAEQAARLSVATPVPVAAPPKPEPRPAPPVEKREEDVASDAYRQRVMGLLERYDRVRDRMLAAERELRTSRRLAEHNRRAYRITQLQLDLAEDRIYFLEHGHAPGTRKTRLNKALGLGDGEALPAGATLPSVDEPDAADPDWADGPEGDNDFAEGPDAGDASDAAHVPATPAASAPKPPPRRVPTPAGPNPSADEEAGLAADLAELAARAQAREPRS